MEYDKQQISKVRSNPQTKNSKTKATPKQLWICPMDSSSAAFSWQEDTNEEINQSSTLPVLFCSFFTYSACYVWYCYVPVYRGC